MIAESRQVVQRTLDGSSAEEKADYGVIKEKIRNDLKRYIQKSMSRRPLDHAGHSGDLRYFGTSCRSRRFACLGRPGQRRKDDYSSGWPVGLAF